MADIDHNTLALITTLVGAILGGGGLVAWYKARSENRKTEAEAWAILVENLSKRIAALEKRLDEKNAVIQAQEIRIAELEKEIEARDARIAALEEKVNILEHKRANR